MLIRAFCHPNKPRLRFLEFLMISSFQCSRDDGQLLLSTLLNVKSMTLNFNFLPSHFCISLTSRSPLLCPRLEVLKVSGLTTKRLKALIKARKISPTPIRHLFLDEDDTFSPGTIQWLKRQVETVSFFENSDVESDDEDEYDSEDWTNTSHGSSVAVGRSGSEAEDDDVSEDETDASHQAV